MNKDLAIVKKEVERLKRTAEEFPFNMETEGMPERRHWADLPGDIRICFTNKYDDKESFYHLSISQASGTRAHNTVVMALLKMFNAPQKIEELNPLANSAVRHFMWEKEGYGKKD